jgi:hypothetical protein
MPQLLGLDIAPFLETGARTPQPCMHRKPCFWASDYSSGAGGLETHFETLENDQDLGYANPV